VGGRGVERGMGLSLVLRWLVSRQICILHVRLLLLKQNSVGDQWVQVSLLVVSGFVKPMRVRLCIAPRLRSNAHPIVRTTDSCLSVCTMQSNLFRIHIHIQFSSKTHLIRIYPDYPCFISILFPPSYSSLPASALDLNFDLDLRSRSRSQSRTYLVASNKCSIASTTSSGQVTCQPASVFLAGGPTVVAKI
jgi:hypothetical protein